VDKHLARIEGKWAYVWQLSNILGGDLSLVVKALLDSGTTGVAIKAHNGSYAWSDPKYRIFEFVDLCQKAGIRVVLWGYIYLRYNPIGEANAAGDMMDAIPYADAYLIDAEGPAKLQWAQAKLFMAQLKRRIKNRPLALNSYRFPKLHPELPWGTLRAGTHFDCPQVYYRNLNPTKQLYASKAAFAAMSPKLPFIPAGDMYAEFGIKPAAAAVDEYLHACHVDPDIPATIMWSMDQMARVPELWAAYSKYLWPVGGGITPSPTPLPSPKPYAFSAVVTARYLNQRQGPDAGYPLAGPALRQGDRVEVEGVIGNWGAISDDAWVSLRYVQRI
jgi:hypothetical protein